MFTEYEIIKKIFKKNLSMFLFNREGTEFKISEPSSYKE